MPCSERAVNNCAQYVERTMNAHGSRICLADTRMFIHERICAAHEDQSLFLSELVSNQDNQPRHIVDNCLVLSTYTGI